MAMKQKSKMPKKLSPGEECFVNHCKHYELTPEREFHFMDGRKWRADFAFVDEKILVEIEGGVFTRGGHTRGAAYTKNCQKYNHAALLGYRILRFTTDQVLNGDAIDMTCKVLGIKTED